jgi:uncharacterized protein with FMN-binding domain
MDKKKTIISIAAVVAVAAAIFGIASANKKISATDTATSTSTTTPVATAPASAVSGSTEEGSEYKDGTYTATGSYQSPGGPDHIGVTVTLKNDIITSASITPEPGDRTSAHYQSLFASGYQAVVVGKDISTLHVDAVSGSSLTPIGFNDAISQIKTQAKA